MIQLLEIHNLFGHRTVRMNFNSNCKILVGENGQGKTTILSILQAVLTFNLSRLTKLPFEAITVQANEQMVNISKKELIGVIPIKILSEVKKTRLKELLHTAIGSKEAPFLKGHLPHSTHELALYQEFMKPSNREVVMKLIMLSDLHNPNVFYFPTFRRVEEDYTKLTRESRSKEFHIIPTFNDYNIVQSDMEDVQELINSITGSIKNITVAKLNTLSFDLLNKIGRSANLGKNPDLKINPDLIRPALGRIKEHLNPDTLEVLNDLLKNKKMDKDITFQHIIMIYLMSNLGEIFEETRKYDSEIKTFSRVVSQYLNQKQIIYDEQAVSLEVRSQEGSTLKLSQLSTGEKQLISIFAKTILQKKNSSHPMIIIIDEPELSLSIHWQRRLLTDLLENTSCRLLVSATHSPFIFDNILTESVQYVE